VITTKKIICFQDLGLRRSMQETRLCKTYTYMYTCTCTYTRAKDCIALKMWIVYVCKPGSKPVLFKIWCKYTSIRGLTSVAKHSGIIHVTCVISETASVGQQSETISSSSFPNALQVVYLKNSCVKVTNVVRAQLSVQASSKMARRQVYEPSMRCLINKHTDQAQFAQSMSTQTIITRSTQWVSCASDAHESRLQCL